MDALEHDGNVLTWRVNDLAAQQKELVKVVQSSTTALGAQITALSNQIGQGLASLPDHYAPRREAEERHRGINERIETLDRLLAERDKTLEDRLEQYDRRLSERRENVDDQVRHVESLIKSNADRIDRLERAGWGVAIGMMMLLLGVLFAIFRTSIGSP